MLQISPVWNEECKDLMLQWKMEGLTAGQIANKFNTRGFSLTRNAIIGKLFRDPRYNPAIHSYKRPCRSQIGPIKPKLPSIVGKPVWIDPPEVVESLPAEVNKMSPRWPHHPKVLRASMLPPVPEVFTGAAEAIFSLSKHQCRYPEGHVESGLAFCTKTSMKDSPYCKGHHRLAHRYVMAP